MKIPYNISMTRRGFHKSLVSALGLLGYPGLAAECPREDIKSESMPIGLTDGECLLWASGGDMGERGRVALGVRLDLPKGSFIDRMVFTDASMYPFGVRYFDASSGGDNRFLYFILDQLSLFDSKYHLYLRVLNSDTKSSTGSNHRIFRKTFAEVQRGVISSSDFYGNWNPLGKQYEVMTPYALPKKLLRACVASETPYQECLASQFIRRCTLKKVTSDGSFLLSLDFSNQLTGFFLVLDPVGRPLAIAQAELGQEGAFLIGSQGSLIRQYGVDRKHIADIRDCPYLMVLGLHKAGFFTRQDLWLSY